MARNGGNQRGRNTSAYWEARKRFVAQAHREERPCWRCGGGIDYTAASRAPLSPSVDHVTELAAGGSLLDQSNWRIAHYSCNSSAGATFGNRRRGRPRLPVLPDTPTVEVERTSRDW